MRKAYEEVEVDGTIGMPDLRGGDDLAKHPALPEHRPEKRRAHARRLEDLPKIRDLIRVREDQRALVLRHPPWMAQVEGDMQAVLLRRKPELGNQEMVLTIWCDEKDARALSPPGRRCASLSPRTS